MSTNNAMSDSGDREIWHKTPPRIWFKVDNTKISALGNEVTVTLIHKGEVYAAIVPLHAVNESSCEVSAIVVGTVGSTVLVNMPAGAMGTATWKVPDSLYKSRGRAWSAALGLR